MAGLTREQRAAKAAVIEAAKALEASPPAPDVDLVLMAKQGEEIEVHPTCVKAHAKQGWAEV